MGKLPDMNFGIFYFAQCFSGGFAKAMGVNNMIGISSANGNETSKGDMFHASCFTYFLFNHLLKQDVCVEKAFKRAAFRDTLPWNYLRGGGETPQICWQNANPGNIYLGNKQVE